MKMWKNLAAGICIGIMALSAGCGSSNKNSVDNAKADKQEIIAYGVVDPQISAQQIIADKKGYFKEEGLNVKNKFLQSGGEISPVISGGTAQVSFESPYTDIALAANNVGVKIVAPMADIGNTQCVVAGKNSGINNAKDLEGKKIGIASGAGVMIAIRNMCKEMGVDVNKIKFVTLAPSDQIAALEHGDIDAMACWEPWVGTAVEQGGKLLFSGRKAYLADKKGDVNWMSFYTTFQVTDKFLKEHPEDIQKMLKALKKATDFINKNPDEASKIIADQLNLKQPQVKEIMSKNVYSMKYDQNFVQSCQDIADFMLEMKNIPNKVEPKAYLDDKALQTAIPDMVTVK